MATKHYIFHTHKSHKSIGYILLIVILIFLLAMLMQNFATVSEAITDNPQHLTNFLLFVLILILLILTIMIAFFIVEIKDKYFET